MRRSRVHNENGAGIVARNKVSGKIQDCEISFNAYEGVQILNQSTVTVTGCTISGHADRVAISVRDASSATVEGCRLLNEGGSLHVESSVQSLNNIEVPQEYEEAWKRVRSIADQAAQAQEREKLRNMWQKYRFAPGK